MRIEKITARALERMGDDRYKLSLLVSKRAEQLSNGAEPLVKVESSDAKFTDIALLEVAEGKISIESLSNID